MNRNTPINLFQERNDKIVAGKLKEMKRSTNQLIRSNGETKIEGEKLKGRLSYIEERIRIFFSSLLYKSVARVEKSILRKNERAPSFPV